MSILITIIILGVIIFVHELGHFATAKFFNIPVSEFALGMGPQLLSKKYRNTVYSIRAFPIGGFVNIEGMEIDSTVEDGFNTKPPLHRFIVLIAGVVMNFILTYIIIYIVVIISGKSVVTTEPIIGNTLKGSYAEKVLLPNDRIVAINGKAITTWDDINSSTKSISNKSNTNDSSSGTSYAGSSEKTLQLKIERDNATKDITVKMYFNKDEGRGMIGISPLILNEKFGKVEAISVTTKTFGNMFIQIIDGFKSLFAGKVKSEEVSGPLGIIKTVGTVKQDGTLSLVWLLAVLSLNIGIFNLLPVPALDGGRIIFVLCELVGVKTNKKLEERVHRAGMILLFSLIIAITINDIINL